MILINLLPHREAARKRRKDTFFVTLGLAVLVGGLICGAIFTWYQTRISGQESRNSFLQAQIKLLEEQIKDVATLQSEIAALRARQLAVEDLQSDRNMPVHLLNELVKQLPDGVYINSLKQTGTALAITGVAQSNERVSELLRALGNNSVWMTRPELVEIVSSSITLGARDQRRVANFSIKATLRKPTDLAAANLAASAALANALAVNASTTPTPAASAAKK